MLDSGEVEFVSDDAGDWEDGDFDEIAVHLHEPHDGQREINRGLRRFNVLACGRRYGKSLYCGDKIIETAIEGGPCAWYTPNYKYLNVAWRQIAETLIPLKRHYKQTDPRRIEIVTGGSIDFWSLDDNNAGRSNAYARVVIDEAAMVKNFKYCWEATIRATLADLKGDAFFPSTPQGYDYFHELWERGQSTAAKDAEWASWQHPTSRNPSIPPEEIEAARATLDPRYFAQEYEASFEMFMGRVFYGFKRAANVRADLVDFGGDLGIGMDFNVNPMTAAVFVKAADQIHYIDEIHIENSGTEEMCQEIARRYVGENATSDVVRFVREARHIVVYPDATAKARKTSSGPTQTDLTIIEGHGFQVQAPRANPPVEDRIKEANAMLCNAKGVRRAFMHPRCAHIIKSFDQLARKEGTSIIDKSSGLEHMADAATYPIHVLFPIAKASVGRMRPGG